MAGLLLQRFSPPMMFFEDSEQLRASQEYADVFRGAEFVAVMRLIAEINWKYAGYKQLNE